MPKLWIAQVAYNTTKPKSDRAAYRTTVFPLDSPHETILPTNRLIQTKRADRQ